MARAQHSAGILCPRCVVPARVAVSLFDKNVAVGMIREDICNIQSGGCHG